MWLAFYALALITSFYLIAQVSDRYFVISLDQIAKRFNMSHDMAGATLMAIGSSAPELFVAIIALVRSGGHEEIGVGTIVGSALFNLLVIIGVSVIVKDAKLQWQPILRDLLFYTIAILTLYTVFIDGIITTKESLVLMLMYGGYILAVIYWRKIFKYEADDDEVEEEDDDEIKTGWQVIFIPLDFILSKIFPPKKKYFLTFIFSIGAIAVLCWVLVESAIGISAILGIPEVVVALVIIAAGTSIPDMISSVIVARQGRGGMAMSNAIGSNIFDIFIGLGLPWFVIAYVRNRNIEVESAGLNESIIFLIGSVILIFLVLLFSKWQIKKPVGYILVGAYVMYIVYQLALLY